MLFTKGQFPAEVRSRMRDGAGDISLTPQMGDQLPPNCRIFSVIEVPVGASIGVHPHDGECEIYYFLSGEGVATDDGVERNVRAGDTLFTGNGHNHSVRNTGSEPLTFLAVIITE